MGDNAYVQVFDSTRGLKIGEKVEFEGHMLEATLAPGLLSRNYDGLQNDLEKMDGLFIARGSITDPIDFEKKWEFKPLAKPGDKVSAASWLGQVKEEWVEHKIMVPFTMEGRSEEHTSELQSLSAISYAVSLDRKSTRLNSSHYQQSRMPSSA